MEEVQEQNLVEGTVSAVIYQNEETAIPSCVWT